MDKEIEEAAKLFDNNSDCYADTWNQEDYKNSDELEMTKGPVIPAITKERFLKVITEWLSQQPLTVKPVEDEPEGIEKSWMAKVMFYREQTKNLRQYIHEHGIGRS